MTLTADMAGAQSPATDPLEAAMQKAQAQLEAAEQSASANPGEDVLDSDSTTGETETPTAQAPEADTDDSGEPEASAEGEPKSEAEPKVSRRQRGEQLRQQIEAEYEAKLDAKLADLRAELASVKESTKTEIRAEHTQQQETQRMDQATANLRAWAKGHKEGQFESTEQLANWVADEFIGDGDGPPRVLVSAFQRGRDAMLAEIGRDMQQAPTVTALDAQAQKELLSAPSLKDLVERAITIGKRQADADAQARVTAAEEARTLAEARAEEYKGKLASRGATPEGPGGGKPTVLDRKARNFDEAASKAAAQLGIDPASLGLGQTI